MMRNYDRIVIVSVLTIFWLCKPISYQDMIINRTVSHKEEVITSNLDTKIKSVSHFRYLPFLRSSVYYSFMFKEKKLKRIWLIKN